MADRHHRVKALFLRAREVPAAARAAWLEEACGGNAAVREEVASLLAADEEMPTSYLAPQDEAGLSRGATPPPSARSGALSTGTHLGRYEIVAPLGAGGMGEVYRARDPLLDREVAIKVLPPAFAADGERLRRFEQEARAASRLNHPNITTVYDIGTHEGTTYLVSELLHGETLGAVINRGPMPVSTAVGCAIQVARGLAAAHDVGVVHRDLKPENLWMLRGGRVKILDFGLAKLRPAGGDQAGTVTASVTATMPGVVMGTPAYMAPEQVRGAPTDARCDIFAFGAILYEMLAGRRAFAGASAIETMSAVLTEDPLPLRDLVPELPPSLEGLVYRCLEKNPEARFQSARDTGHALEALSALPAVRVRISDTLTSIVRRAFQNVQTRPQRKQAGIVTAVALAALMTAGYAYHKHRQVSQRQAVAQELFYAMKSLDVDMTNLEQSGSAKGRVQVEKYKTRRRQLESMYNGQLAVLNVYDQSLSEEERLILRVTRLFGECELTAPADYVRQVKSYIQKWRSSRRYARALNHAQRMGYTKTIAEELLAQNLPPQFFYLAMHESNFNALATGAPTRMGIAKGMWQFVPPTATQYGLTIGPLAQVAKPDPGDDRHHWQKATRAAAQYIKDIYSTDAQASGLLAMVAYNWGESQFWIELLRSTPENPAERNFWKLVEQHRHEVPRQAYDYVFHIVSAAVIGENPRLFGFPFDNPLRFLEAHQLDHAARPTDRAYTLPGRVRPAS